VGIASPLPKAPVVALASTAEMRAPPLRLVETWGEILLGFVACVVLPIGVWAQAVPFADGIGVAERTIIATAVAYAVVAYCSRRLDSFPGNLVSDHIAYIAPVVAIAYATIMIGLVALRLEYARVQLFSSGALTLLWTLAVASFRARLFARTYAVVPQGLLREMPGLTGYRWLSFDEALGRSARVDAVVADLGAGLSDAELSELARAAIAGVPVLDRRYILESLTGRTPLGGLTPNEFGALLPSRQYLLFRRIVEMTVTLMLLPVLLPVLLFIAAIIRADSTGPIFFTQARVGWRGRVFRMVKFRTMRHGMTGPSFTTTSDLRITRIGAVLRRYRLDELPQLWNILCGHMSWIGPRPEALALGKAYARDIPHFELRGIVRPGITGWAQINQGYAHTPEEMRAKLEYDLYYLKHCSLWLDLVIILRTITVVLGGAGAR
jgi:lipopolysaccharide/colanic/teichoic acid biosynthesis glycosyltransferase